MPHQCKTLHQADNLLLRSACLLRSRLRSGSLEPADAIAPLVELLYADDYAASMLAMELLTEHGGDSAIVPLIETVFWSETDDDHMTQALRCAAIDALRRVAPDDEMVVGTMVAATRDPDAAVARAAVEALAHCRSQGRRAVRALGPCLLHQEARIRVAAKLSMNQLLSAPRVYAA